MKFLPFRILCIPQKVCVCACVFVLTLLIFPFLGQVISPNSKQSFSPLFLEGARGGIARGIQDVAVVACASLMCPLVRFRFS